MRRISLTILTALAMGLVLPAAAQDSLTVYTYDSFTSDWGPGPVVEAAFEAECGCEVDFVAVADGVALLNRLRLEGENTEADIVLGLDTNLIVDAKDTGLFVPHEISIDNVDVPGGWEDEIFVPYDYGYFAFVYEHGNGGTRRRRACANWSTAARNRQLSSRIRAPRRRAWA